MNDYRSIILNPIISSHYLHVLSIHNYFMEFLRSITVHSPSLLELFRFGLVMFLQSVKDVLLIYPINVAIFCILIFAVVFKLIGRFRAKQPFKAVYSPLKHQDNNVEEVKLLKK